MIPAGEFRQRVRLEQLSNSSDDSQGGTSEVWSLLDVLRAKVETDEAGTESMAAMHSAQVIRHTVTLRYRTGVTPSMRLILGTRILQIESAIPVQDGLHRKLVLKCLENVTETTTAEHAS